MTADLRRLRDLLGTQEAAWLLARLTKRMAQGEPLTGIFRIGKPSDEQREWWGRLVGEYGRGQGLRVDLGALERQIRDAGLADSLAEAVTALRGPVANRRQNLMDKTAAWDLAFREPPANATEVWAALRQAGLVKRLVGDDPMAGAVLLRQAAEVLARLPAHGLPLPEVAAVVTGDAHALDAGRPLSTVVLRAVRTWTGVDPTDRRLAWASVGVELDSLSSSVLVLGLRASGDGLVARLLAECAAAGEPCRLTLRQLRREPLEIHDGVVFVCENPAVVLAAADRLGRRSRPLVCVEGQPSSAARAVLAAVGSRARYHGDFDWPGIRIAADVLNSTGGLPWRFDSTAYTSAAKGLELQGIIATTPWDPALAALMQADGRAVHEEAVVADLVADLES